MKLIAALRVDCGITSDEYWDLTWAQVQAYLARKEANYNRQDFRIGGLLLEIRSLFQKTHLSPLSIWPWHDDVPEAKKETNELRANFASRAKFQKEQKK